MMYLALDNSTAYDVDYGVESVSGHVGARVPNWAEGLVKLPVSLTKVGSIG
jgi:hypothetical protein